MNPDLKALLTDLLQQHRQLADKLDTEADPDLGQAIVTEMGEVLHRIDLVQNLLMIAAAQSVTNALANLKAQSAALTTAIAQAEQIQDVVTAVSTYLGYVDIAIDLAKLV